MELSTKVKIIKAVNIVTALLLMVLGGYSMYEFLNPNNFELLKIWSIFAPLFIIGFGCMLIALDFKQEFMFEWFYFLANFFGRGIFYIFTSSVCIYWNPQAGASSRASVVNYILGLTIFCVGIFFMILQCTADQQVIDEMKGELAKPTTISTTF